VYDGTDLFPVGGLVGVLGRCSVASGLAGLLCDSPSSGGEVNVSPIGFRCLGLGDPRPDIPIIDCLCFSLSSVALSRASKAWSSDVCVETAFFLR
jgi:hypothetical protein